MLLILITLFYLVYLQNLKISFIEMLPKIENHKLYIQEAIKAYYYEDLGYLNDYK